MKRASPIDLRDALNAANTMCAAGLLFVPMPVLDAADYKRLLEQSYTRLVQIEQDAEKEQQS